MTLYLAELTRSKSDGKQLRYRSSKLTEFFRFLPCKSIGLQACICVTTMYPRDNYDVTSCCRDCIEYINIGRCTNCLGRDTGAIAPGPGPRSAESSDGVSPRTAIYSNLAYTTNCLGRDTGAIAPGPGPRSVVLSDCSILELIAPVSRST